MKKNTSWKFTDELSITFQLSVSGAGEFGLSMEKPHGKTKTFADEMTIGKNVLRLPIL